MRQLLLALSLAVVGVGCASQTLVPREQAVAIKNRDEALALHAAAIQDRIRQSGRVGALAFLDTGDGHLVVLPGDSPANAWARYIADPSGSPTGRAAVPPVITFVYRADLPKEPDSVTTRVLEEQEALRTTLAALDTELRTLSDSIVATRREAQTSLTTAREDTQKALDALAGELAEARKFMLQTAQVGWLNQEMNVENANALRKSAAASQEASVSSAKLAETMRHLSDSLAGQLKELAARLEAIQNRITNIK
jgi:G:T/U-mismatch repair DNA glycosylase